MFVLRGVGQGLEGIGGQGPRKHRYGPPGTHPEASGGPRRSKIRFSGFRGSTGGGQTPGPCLPYPGPTPLIWQDPHLYRAEGLFLVFGIILVQYFGY